MCYKSRIDTLIQLVNFGVSRYIFHYILGWFARSVYPTEFSDIVTANAADVEL